MKQLAKEGIKGNIGIMFITYLVFGLISGTLIGSLFAPAMILGINLMCIGMAQGTKPALGDLFKRANAFGKALWLAIITGFFTMLWMMLLYVPGIIKAISYSMGSYILAENPELTAREALNESKRIMNGHKMDFFILMLSFIPWFLLCGVTFGIAYIYVFPYMSVTIAQFYTAIKGGPAPEAAAAPPAEGSNEN